MAETATPAGAASAGTGATMNDASLLTIAVPTVMAALTR